MIKAGDNVSFENNVSNKANDGIKQPSLKLLNKLKILYKFTLWDIAPNELVKVGILTLGKSIKFLHYPYRKTPYLRLRINLFTFLVFIYYFFPEFF